MRDGHPEAPMSPCPSVLPIRQAKLPIEDIEKEIMVLRQLGAWQCLAVLGSST